MTEKPPLLSEGEESESFLVELESEGEVREIAGLESGFSSLSRALNGILPGLYLLIGPPSCGKTAFVKQLCDQAALHNSVPTFFFTFTESKTDLRIRTLARLSGLENREIRRGRSFLLHWYGVPKAKLTDLERLPPSWERLQRVAEEAKGWLDLFYLFECPGKTELKEIEERISMVREIKRSQGVMVVIDDSQRLGPLDLPLEARLVPVVEQLQSSAVEMKIPILATWPDFSNAGAHEWAEKVPCADVVLVMENDAERTKRLTEPNRAINLHIVKNRGGEKGTVAFDFFPAFSKFAEVAADSNP